MFLICKSVWYYSMIDEDLFFEWVKKIPSISTFNGVKDELYLHLTKNCLPDEDLRELLALFYRYQIDMKQFKVFLNSDNKEWFYDNETAYWHKKVFGNE